MNAATESIVFSLKKKRKRGNLNAMNTTQAMALIENNLDEGPEAIDDPEVINKAWQYLIDRGTIWQLPTWYGRTAAAMIEAGELQPPRGI